MPLLGMHSDSKSPTHPPAATAVGGGDGGWGRAWGVGEGASGGLGSMSTSQDSGESQDFHI